MNHQNIEYFENLACEYTLQLDQLEKGEKSDGTRGPVFMNLQDNEKIET